MKYSTKITLIVTAILIISICGGGWALLNNAQKAIESSRQSSVNAANEILILVAGSWSYEIAELRLAPEFASGRSREQIQSEFDEYKNEFGTLVNGDPHYIEFHIDDDDLKDPIMIATFTSNSEFEKGKAKVDMTLIRRPKNPWQLAKLTVKPTQ